MLDEFIVMPDHFHGIVVINNDHFNGDVGMTGHVVGAHGRAPLHREPRSLGSLMAGFKSAVTKRINELRQTSGQPVWQRNYFDRIIRNDRELNYIRDYIMNNPLYDNKT